MDWLFQHANQQKDAAEAADPDDLNFIDDDEDIYDEQEDNAEPPASNHIHDPKAILYDLGYMEKIPIKEDDETTTHLVIPQCSFYANHGKGTWVFQAMWDSGLM